MKLGTKIYCLEIQGTDYLISKKCRRLKWMLQQNFQPAPNVIRKFCFSLLAFNSIFLS
jgi:hypothetical protein